MKNNLIDTPWQTAVYSTFGAGIFVLVTYLGYLCHLNLATAGFLCLVVVVLLSSFGSMTSSAIHSIVAVASLDYFFAPPIHSLQVSDPHNMLALAAFLTTSLGITFQVTRVRNEREHTLHERGEVKRLYELAQQLMALKPEDIDTPRLLTLFRDVFALRAVCLFENKTAGTYMVGEPRYDLETRTRMGYLIGVDSDDPLCRTSVRCLRIEGKETAVLGFEWPDTEGFTPYLLSTLETTMLERVRAFHSATQASVAAQAESLRNMLLDALAHAVKTPLATILTAMGGMRETGGLTADHLEFVDVVETETARLSNLTTRLLRMATLDREEVKPRLQRVDIPLLIAEELDVKSQQFDDHRFSFTNEEVEGEGTATDIHDVEADPELLRLALSQLLENACKYSQSGSTVKVSAQATEDSIAIRVRSRSHIPVGERSKIFDRFYRGEGSRDATPGTGLGLDIGRKIMMAHGGTLALEDSSETESVFRITIPVFAKGF
jgi:two-component system, OmpR family, sensor histidine kinase KdpD